MNIKQKSEAEKALSSWRVLNYMITDLSVEQLDWMLDKEMQREMPRSSIVTRIHQRLTSLRTKQERAKLLER